jgi:hypothetical protein
MTTVLEEIHKIVERPHLANNRGTLLYDHTFLTW